MIEMWRNRPKLGRKNLDIGQIVAERGIVGNPFMSLPRGTLLSEVFLPCPKVGDITSCHGG